MVSELLVEKSGLLAQLEMAEIDSTEKTTMFKLTSTNYNIWKPRMMDLLVCKDYYHPIMGEPARPNGKTDEQWKWMNMKTCSFIRQWIDNGIYQLVAKEQNAKALWDTLENTYERKSSQNKSYVVKQLVRLRYEDDKSMAEHTSKFRELVDRLANLQISLDDELQACLLLGTLPDSWETLVVAINNSAPQGKITMSMVSESLLNEEARRTENGYTSQAELLVTERQGRGRNRNFKNSDSTDKLRGRSKSRSGGVRCYKCNKLGHIRRNCRELNKSNSRKGGEDDEEDEGDETTAVMSDEELAVVVREEECLGVKSNDCTWVADSAATSHATPHRGNFSSYTSGNFGYVKMGNKARCKVIGIGTVCLKTNTGCKLVLKNVRHIPDIRLNLISTPVLDKEGYINNFRDGKWKLRRGNLVIARGKKDSLFRTQAKLWKGVINAVGDTSTRVWRQQPNVRENGRQIIDRKNVNSSTGALLKPRSGCLDRKQRRVTFQETLQLVNGDGVEE